jgi:hypothetical protein
MVPRWFISSISIVLAVAAACTPPHPEEPVRPAQRATPPQTATREGVAAGGAGIAWFATQDQLYKAFAELITGSITQGRDSYSLAVGEEDEEQRRAMESLRRLAVRETNKEARREGKRLRRAVVDVRKIDAMTYYVQVTSIVDEPGRGRHQERRDGTVTFDDQGRPHLAWAAPPEL